MNRQDEQEREYDPMADADAATAVEEKTVRLQVAAARQEESGQGIARMPRSAFQALGITEGDVVEKLPEL